MASITTALAAPAEGNDNPTLDIHLLAVRDHSPGLQFLDIMKFSSTFGGHSSDQYNAMSKDQLEAGGYLDADGWLIRMPDGIEKVGNRWMWRPTDPDVSSRAGTYVLNYEGEGDLQLQGATILSREDGKIVFETSGDKNLFVMIHDTDPDGTGDYLRNITVVKEENIPLYEAGATFNPDWVELIQDSRELRFMWWQDIINTNRTEWENRITATSAPDREVALEHMVQLANEVGADAWFTIPHLASDEYIRQFATYVRDNLDPSLKAKVEYSNENWNWGYQSTHWLHDQAVAEWDNPGARFDYQAKMATNAALIWEEVFAESPDRLVNVLGSHTPNPWVTERMLNPKVWQENEPDTYVDPKTVFDEIAVTTYFGNATLTKDEYRLDLLDAIRDPNVDAYQYLYDRLLDPAYERSIPEITSFLKQQADIAEAHGMTLSLYEGGSHLHHLIKKGTQEEKDILNEFILDFVKSPYMVDLYQKSWDDWAEIGKSPYMQFGDMSYPSKWGSFQIFEGLDEITDRGQKLLDLNASTTPWWDAEGGDHYRQGIIQRGTEGSDTLIGTSQEDFLLGGDGDDIFVGGLGNDGLNGGAGVDRAILSGSVGDYVVHAEGKGFRVTGPDGRDYLFGIEELGFDDGTVVDLAGLVVPNDGPTPVTAPTAPVIENELVSPSGEDAGDSNVLQGGAGSNTIEGSAGEDVIFGGAGDDLLTGRQGDDLLQGNTGEDSIFGNTGEDVLLGQAGDDFLSGGGSSDLLDGGKDGDVLRGMDGEDVLLGRTGGDVLSGGDDGDRLHGGRGNDVIKGGNGNDKLFTGKGSDIIIAGEGADEIWAKQGHNLVRDFSEDDLLHFRGNVTADDIAVTDEGLLLEGKNRSVLLEGLDADDMSWVLPNIVA